MHYNLPAFIRVYPEFANANVECGRCGAKTGELCKSNSNPRIHQERMDAATDLMVEQYKAQGYKF